jgi:hypothetical protein
LRKRKAIIASIIASSAQNPRKRRKQPDIGLSSIKSDPLEVLFTRFIAANNQAIALIECPTFRDLIYYFNEEAEELLPRSYNTIQTWILRNFAIMEDYIKSRIQNARSKIHISIDRGKSPNNKPLLIVFAYYIGEEGGLEKSLICCKEVEGIYEGENLAIYIIKAL